MSNAPLLTSNGTLTDIPTNLRDCPACDGVLHVVDSHKVGPPVPPMNIQNWVYDLGCEKDHRWHYNSTQNDLKGKHSFQMKCPNNHAASMLYAADEFANVAADSSQKLYCITCDTRWRPAQNVLDDALAKLRAKDEMKK